MPSRPTFDLPKIDLSKIKLPFDLPNVDLPTIDLPSVDMPSAEQIIDFFKDVTFASTGLVGMTAERVAELQKQLVEVLRTQVQKVRSTV